MIYIVMRSTYSAISHVEPSHGTIICDSVDFRTGSTFDILKHVAVRDLVVFSAVSDDSKAMVDGFFLHHWEKALRNFVPNVTAFRDVLRASHSVISGSLALWFVSGGATTWTPNDCDIYCPNGEAESISLFLRTHAGYIPDDRKPDFFKSETESHYDGSEDPRINPSIDSVLHLCQYPGRTIDIIESSGLSALEPLPRFWSTFLPNYVSADTFCVPFPYNTLASRGCLTLGNKPVIAPVLRAMEKYKDRGFVITDFSQNITPSIQRGYPLIAEGCDNNPYCPHTWRHFGDRWCLQYSFDEGNGTGWPADEQTTKWRYGGEKCASCEHSSSFEVSSVAIKDIGEYTELKLALVPP